jgi:predicted MFS family arabinose efflux permease
MTSPESWQGSAEASPAANRRLILLAAGMFAVGTDSFVIAPLLPFIARDFGVTIAAAAQLITAYALTYALCSPFVATVTAHWPRQRTILAGLTIFVLANVGAAFAPGFATVLVARALAGLGAAIFAPVAAATATGLVAAGGRGRALSIMMIGLSSATALGAPLGTLVGSVADWRTVFLLVAALAAAVDIAVAVSMRAGAEVDDAPLAERLRPLRDARVFSVLLTTFLVLTGLYISYTYISVIFDRATGHDGARMALLQSIWGFAGIAGAALAGRLTDRWSSTAVVRLTLVVVFVDFALLPLTSAHPASAAAAMVVWGLCGWGFVVPQQYRLIGMAPQAGPILLALYTMAVYAGTSASGVIGALALHVVGPHQLPLVGAGLILSGLAVEEYARRRHERMSFAMPGV